MKNSDEAVERVLAGMREVEAPEGMERRILEAVGEDVPEQRQGWSLGRRAMPWRLAGTMSWATAAAGVAVVAGMLCWSSLRSSWTGGRAGDTSAMTKGQTGGATAPVQKLQAAAAGPVQRPPRKVNAASRNGTGLRRPAVVPEKEVADVRTVSAESYPAPPMPLTKQERLLLRVVRKADPAEIAMLDPAVRAARDAEETAEVEKFFEPAATEGDHE